MSPKQSAKNRRKNCAPKRVVHDYDDGKLFAKSILVSAEDPVELAKQIMEQPITNFFKYPEIAATFIEIVEKAKEKAVEGEELIYKCSMCNEKVYRSAAGLNYHLMNSCPGIDPHLTCLICEKKYLDSDKIIEHIQGRIMMKLVLQVDFFGHVICTKVGFVVLMMTAESVLLKRPFFGLLWFSFSLCSIFVSHTRINIKFVCELKKNCVYFVAKIDDFVDI